MGAVWCGSAVWVALYLSHCCSCYNLWQRHGLRPSDTRGLILNEYLIYGMGDKSPWNSAANNSFGLGVFGSLGVSYTFTCIFSLFSHSRSVCIVYWYIFDSAYSMLRDLGSDSSANFASFAHPAQTPNSSARPDVLPVSCPTDTYNFRKK